MASKYRIETRDERIDRMVTSNPSKPIELCAAVVDGIWDKKRESILSKIPERFSEADVADLGYLTKEVVESVEEMFKGPKENEKVGVIFSGPAGSGKTHAAYAVIKMLAERNPEVVAYMTGYTKMTQELRQEFNSGSYDELGSTWDKLNNESGMYDGVIFIDDMSSSHPTDFEIDKLMMFLDNRMNEYMPFLITTNIEPEKFEEVYGTRIASRLLGYTKIVRFETLDKRIDKNPL